MNITDFIPPVLTKIIKVFKRPVPDHDIEYESYSMAMENCIIDGYQNIELCNMIADKTAFYIETLKKKPYFLTSTNVFLLAAINRYINLHSKKTVKILDFGGACGSHYFEMRRFIPEHTSLAWHVVETEQMVKSAIEKGLPNSELQFATSIDAVKTAIDIFHSSGTLQCVSNPYVFVEMLLNCKAEWIFFNRMMFNENDRDIVTVQKSLLSSNGHGKLPPGYVDRELSYPHTTLAFEKFNSTITSSGYELELMFEELSGVHQINNEKIIGRGLLYKKIG